MASKTIPVSIPLNPKRRSVVSTFPVLEKPRKEYALQGVTNRVTHVREGAYDTSPDQVTNLVVLYFRVFLNKQIEFCYIHIDILRNN